MSAARLFRTAGWIMMTIGMTMTSALAQEDPYRWLEEVQGEKALEWVRARNEVSLKELQAVPGYTEAFDTILRISDAQDRIPIPARYGKFLYNFWKDAEHPRGVLRRTTLESFRKRTIDWETVLDIDALAKSENENWVYKGASYRYPDYRRCLVNLSRGGADAVVVREFDLAAKAFVKGGFELPEAKSSIAWIDADTVFVGTDFGPGSLTTSGYPRIVKIWKRGTSLSGAKTVLEGKPESMSVSGFRIFSRRGNVDLVQERTDFYSGDFYLLRDGRLVKLDLPRDLEFSGLFNRQFLFSLRSDWDTGKARFRKGSVVVGKVDDVAAGRSDFTLLVEPGPRASVEGLDTTRDHVYVTLLDNVVNRIARYTQGRDGKWTSAPVPTEGLGNLSLFNTDERDNDYFLSYQDFLTPPSLWRVSGRTGRKEFLKSLPARFDAEPYQAIQYEAISRDGTRIPYFVVMRKDAKPQGQYPTLLDAYGGFEVSQTPFYLSAMGATWLAKGGVFALANLRGGGEFGPAWHQDAILKNRHKVYEDMIAVSEDLVARRITSPAKLAIQGGSNGGLLVGAVSMMRPDLFKGVVCMVPLLDMKRYSKLLAGASWMAEYGNPDDPGMWDYMKDYSPYHMAKKDAKYPRIFFTTSTRDDRVHPAHARKMVARLLELGHDCLYWENIEGGHGGAANNRQAATMWALVYAYLYKTLDVAAN